MPLIVHSIWRDAALDRGDAVGDGEAEIVMAVRAEDGAVGVRDALPMMSAKKSRVSSDVA